MFSTFMSEGSYFLLGDQGEPHGKLFGQTLKDWVYLQ